MTSSSFRRWQHNSRCHDARQSENTGAANAELEALYQRIAALEHRAAATPHIQRLGSHTTRFGDGVLKALENFNGRLVALEGRVNVNPQNNKSSTDLHLFTEVLENQQQLANRRYERLELRNTAIANQLSEVNSGLKMLEASNKALAKRLELHDRQLEELAGGSSTNPDKTDPSGATRQRDQVFRMVQNQRVDRLAADVAELRRQMRYSAADKNAVNSTAAPSAGLFALGTASAASPHSRFNIDPAAMIKFTSDDTRHNSSHSKFDGATSTIPPKAPRFPPPEGLNQYLLPEEGPKDRLHPIPPPGTSASTWRQLWSAQDDAKKAGYAAVPRADLERWSKIARRTYQVQPSDRTTSEPNPPSYVNFDEDGLF
ncbi:hypothetical protein V8C35DRAFT_117041 [Trichoderma chlorosporum]